MSNHIISMAYKRDLRTAMRKSVMVLLADKASDDGSGIYASKQTMADELCCSKQTVIDTIKGFITEGLVAEIGQRRNDNGYTVEYGINVEALDAVPLVNCHANRQSKRLTGQPAGPVNVADGTGQPAGPKPSMNHTSEAKASSVVERAKSKQDDFPRPEWADPQVWADFMLNRKAKKARNSVTAYRGFLSDIEKHTTADWPPGRLLQHATAKGWAGIYEPNNQERGNGSGSRAVQQVDPDGRSMGRTEAAGLDAFARLTGTVGGGMGGQASPSITGTDHRRAVALPHAHRPQRYD